MIDKAWKNVNPTTIYNCFGKCGFKKTGNVEQSSEPPKITNSGSEWGLLPDCRELTFEDYTHVDDDISVYGILTDTELMSMVSLDEDDEKEDEEEEPLTPVTLSEARKCLTTLRFYALGTDTSDDYFAALTTIENSLDNDKLKSLTQKKITDFFST